MLAVFAFAPAFLHAVALWRDPSQWNLTDLRGWVGLIAITAGWTVLVSLAARRKRALIWPAALFWALLHFANHEYLATMGAVLNLAHWQYLTDAVFLSGSGVSPTHPWLLVATLAGTLAGVLLHERQNVGSADLRPLIGIALCGVLIFGVWPLSHQRASWRQSHFLLQNLGWHFASPSDPARADDPATGKFDARRPDLSGTPRVPLAEKKLNVLLIILESIPGSAIPSLAQKRQVTSPIQLPFLDQFVRAGFTANTFFNQQRQTNRGEYAILCGDLPRLLTRTPKMSETAAMAQAPPHCLPQALKDQGYHTAYLQAAPLVFMEKGRFMPRIGFEEVEGAADLNFAYHRNSWGVDDRAFLEQAADKIGRLEAQSRPWFLTLLTVGTHHPFALPPRHLQTDDEKEGFAKAASYLDESLGAFFKSLKAQGLLDSTLVILTSDESNDRHSVLGEGDDALMLSQAWGIFSAHLPDGKSVHFDEPFMQSDIPLSVLDYLGLPGRSAQFAGRSVFRSYPKPRPILFANTYLNRVGAIDRAGRFIACEENLKACKRYGDPHWQPFAPLLGSGDGGPSNTQIPVPDFVRDAVARSLGFAERGPSEGPFALMDRGATSLDFRAWKPLFSEQGIFIPENAILEWKLSFVMEGEGEARVQVVAPPIASWHGTARAGEPQKLHFTFGTQNAIQRFDPAFAAAQMSGDPGGMQLKVHRAEIRIRGRAEGEGIGMHNVDTTFSALQPSHSIP
jgi:arylsulfatase A-like enzyme